MTVATGRRVPLNTRAPLTLPGMLDCRAPGPVKRRHGTYLLAPRVRQIPLRHVGACHPPQSINLPQPAVQLVPTRENALVTAGPNDVKNSVNR
jgi:hypothetical protein